jgi:hypothetical protein
MVVTGLAADLSSLQERTAQDYEIRLTVHPKDIGDVLRGADMPIPGRKGKVKVVDGPGRTVVIKGDIESVRRFVNDMRKSGVRYKVVPTQESLAEELMPLFEMMVSAPDQLMLAIGPLRSFTRSLDRMMSAGQDLVETAERAGYDRIEIGNAIRAWNRQLGGIYGDFAKAREHFYRAAKASSIPTKRFARRKPKKNLKGMQLPALANDADRIAKALPGFIKKAGNQAAFLLKNLDRLEKKWAKKTPASDQKTFREDAGAVISEFLDLRDLVGGSLFAAMNGIVRRLDAMAELQGGDRFGNPPRPLKVPSPAEVDRRQPKGREIIKYVPTEKAPAPKEMKVSTSKTKTGVEMMTIGGKTYVKQRKPMSAYKGKGAPSSWGEAGAAWEWVLLPEGEGLTEDEMSKHIPGADELFEGIVSMEHRRMAGEYALEDGRTARPLPGEVHMLNELGHLEEAYVGTVYKDGKDTFVDTAFINNVSGMLPGFEVRHLGFGEFEFAGPDASIQFDRMRGRNFPGQSGRSHMIYMHKGDKKIISKLVAKMVKKGKAQVKKAVKVPTPKAVAKRTGMKVAGKPKGKIQKDILDALETHFQSTGQSFQWFRPETLQKLPQTAMYSADRLKKAMVDMAKRGILDTRGLGGDFKLAEEVDIAGHIAERWEQAQAHVFVDALSEETIEALDDGAIRYSHLGEMANVISETFGVDEDDAVGLAMDIAGVSEALSMAKERRMAELKAKKAMRDLAPRAARLGMTPEQLKKKLKSKERAAKKAASSPKAKERAARVKERIKKRGYKAKMRLRPGMSRHERAKEASRAKQAHGREQLGRKLGPGEKMVFGKVVKVKKTKRGLRGESVGMTEAKYKLTKLLKTYKSPNPKDEAHKLGAVLAADMGVGSEVKKHKGGWLMVADDGSGVLFLQEGTESMEARMDAAIVEASASGVIKELLHELTYRVYEFDHAKLLKNGLIAVRRNHPKKEMAYFKLDLDKGVVSKVTKQGRVEKTARITKSGVRGIVWAMYTLVSHWHDDDWEMSGKPGPPFKPQYESMEARIDAAIAEACKGKKKGKKKAKMEGVEGDAAVPFELPEAMGGGPRLEEMTWNTLRDVQASTKAEFTPGLAKRHYFVKLPSGKWTRTLNSPPEGATHVKGRVYKVEKKPTAGKEWWESLDEAIDWKAAAKKLLDKAKGKSRDAHFYRAYMIAVIQGKPHAHLVKKSKGAEKARADLIDLAGKKSIDEAVRPGQYFVVVDVSVPGGRMVSKQIFRGVKKADDLAAKYHKKGRNVQVLDAMWYEPARAKLKAAGMAGE